MSALRNINQLDRANVFLFVWVNLMWATTLICHLKYLELTKEDVDMDDIIDKLKSWERISISIPFTLYFLILFVITIITIIEGSFRCEYKSDFEYGTRNSNDIWYVSFILQWILVSMKTGIFGVFAIFELILYMKLKFYLKSNLNWYFKK